MKGPVLLRGKIALITACVVALAITGISVVTWLVTEHNLRSQLDKSLLASLPPRLDRPPGPGQLRALKIICDEGLPNEGLQQVLQGIQTLSTAGRTCAPPGVDPVVTSAADFVRATTYRDGVTRSGTSARVLLQPLDNGDVLILSRSLEEIDDTLTALAGVLVSVSLFGTLLVAGLGLWLTRRALSHLSDLPRLAASPLAHLPIIDQRLAARNAADHTLERAAELKRLLLEAICQLKPPGEEPFSPADAWRHYNALYFPYVIGLKPYNRRNDHIDLDPASQQALDWLRAGVPERTLHNWQTAAARLVAQYLAELQK